jgi:DNA (cytosine-5)-methyltransferase 1
VRNEKAEDFLSLLRHWDALCKKYDVHNSNSLPRTSNNDEDDENENLPEGTFEVEKLVDICYGDPNSTGKAGLWFKVLQTRFFKAHISVIFMDFRAIFIPLLYVQFYTR